MKLIIVCATCGREKEITIPTESYSAGEEGPREIIHRSGRWITQQNGKNFDVYCSKECAR